MRRQQELNTEKKNQRNGTFSTVAQKPESMLGKQEAELATSAGCFLLLSILTEEKIKL